MKTDYFNRKVIRNNLPSVRPSSRVIWLHGGQRIDRVVTAGLTMCASSRGHFDMVRIGRDHRLLWRGEDGRAHDGRSNLQKRYRGNKVPIIFDYQPVNVTVCLARAFRLYIILILLGEFCGIGRLLRRPSIASSPREKRPETSEVDNFLRPPCRREHYGPHGGGPLVFTSLTGTGPMRHSELLR